MMICKYCGTEVKETHVGNLTSHPDCAGCQVYNAAVAAQWAAARRLAKDRCSGEVTHAWVNEYGFFATVDGTTEQIGSAEEAKAFDELTQKAAANARKGGE